MGKNKVSCRWAAREDILGTDVKKQGEGGVKVAGELTPGTVWSGKREQTGGRGVLQEKGKEGTKWWEENQQVTEIQSLKKKVGARTIQWGKECSFQQMVLEQLAIHMQKNEVWLHLISYTRMNSNK